MINIGSLQQTDSSYDPKTTFAWAISAAVPLADALESMASDLLLKEETDRICSTSTSAATAVARKSNLYPLRAAANISVGGSSNAPAILRNLQALYQEFGVTMTVKKYGDLAERRRVLDQFAARVFRYHMGGHGYVEDDGIMEGNGKGKGKKKNVHAMDVDCIGTELTQTSLYR